MRRLYLLGAAALLSTLGCTSHALEPDPNVFVEATVKDPNITVEQLAAGTNVKGGFTLNIKLGARAVGTAEVSFGNFELVSDDQNTIIVPSLPLAADGHELPLQVEPDTKENVTIVIALGSDLLAKDIGTKLCSFGSAHFRGSLTDSLRGTAQAVLTDSVPVKGCTP